MKKILMLFLVISNNSFAQIAQISSQFTSTSLWSGQNAIDNNINSCWSSVCRVNPSEIEFFALAFTSVSPINYVKIMPRYVNNISCGFPISFSIQSSLNGIDWQTIRSESNFPVANRNDWLIFSLPNTINTQYIRIVSTYLGKDDVNNNVFQIAEILAGYESDFQTKFSYISNEGTYKNSSAVEIRNVGSNNFNPNKLNVWHYDIRKPFLSPASNHSSANIYAPSIVNNGSGLWNIYYGGWDFANISKDNIYMTTTYDNFLTTNNRALVVSNEPGCHANNASVIKLNSPKIDDPNWLMLYTNLPKVGKGFNQYCALPENEKNRTFYATSSDGLNWNFNNTINIPNYPNWLNSNINGGNSLYYEDGVYHIYFDDFSVPNFKVYHATSTDFINYNYTGIAQDRNRVPQDVKSFTFLGQKYYMLGTHLNGNNIEVTLSNSLISFPTIPTFTLYNSNYILDNKITSMGFVKDGDRLYGILYGGNDYSLASFTKNKIYANWLQKKVLFKNNYVEWGDIEEGFGPDRVELFMNTQVETGKFFIYDSDGTTLLYTSPTVTMRAGDIWNYLF